MRFETHPSSWPTGEEYQIISVAKFQLDTNVCLMWLPAHVVFGVLIQAAKLEAMQKKIDALKARRKT